MPLTEFTPLASIAGGALIGAAAVMLMAFQGRIAGVSGIAVRLLPPYADNEFAGRSAFVLGLVAAPLLWILISGQPLTPVLEPGGILLIAAGLLVGFGSVWSKGCTSGHGVCGLSRLSVRSLVATLTFMATAIATVFIIRHLL